MRREYNEWDFYIEYLMSLLIPALIIILVNIYS